MKDLTSFTLSAVQELENKGRFGTAKAPHKRIKIKRKRCF